MDESELDEDQLAARTIFENELFDACEKLRQLRTAELVLTWDEYRTWTLEPLARALAEAKRVGVPGTAPIGPSDIVPFTEAATLAERMDRAFKLAFGSKDDPIAVFKNGQPPANLRRYEAMKTRYTADLSGDKLRLMDEEVLTGAVVYAQDPPKFFVTYYGEGRKVLSSPEDFREARIWVTYHHGHASDDALELDPIWRAQIHRFDGMTLTETLERRGDGKHPPDSMFAGDRP